MLNQRSPQEIAREFTEDWSNDWSEGADERLAQNFAAAITQRDKEHAKDMERERKGSSTPIGWTYKHIVDKHLTGSPLEGQIQVAGVWGTPSTHLHFSPDEPTDPYVYWKAPVYLNSTAATRRIVTLEAEKVIIERHSDEEVERSLQLAQRITELTAERDQAQAALATQYPDMDADELEIRGICI